MKRSLLVVPVVLWLTLAASAQDNQPKVLVNTVSVSADGKYETSPDTALLQFTISAQAGSSEKAYERVSKAAERVRQALRDNGLDPKLVELSSYSLQPQYKYEYPKRKIIGYYVGTNGTLKIKDFAKVGPLLTALADIDDASNQNVNYVLDNIDAAKQKAVEDAVKRARASAQSVATAGGRTLGDLAYAAVDTFEQGPPVPMAMQTMAMERAKAIAAPTEEFTPAKVTITAHVNALFNLK